MLLLGVQDRLSRFYGCGESGEGAEASAIARAHANDRHFADTVGSIVNVRLKNGGDLFEMVNAVCGGAQEIPRCVRHVRERGAPVVYEEREAYGG